MQIAKILAKALFECMPAFPLSHACIVRDLTPIVTIDRRVRLPSPKGEGIGWLLFLAYGMIVYRVYDRFEEHIASPPWGRREGVLRASREQEAF